VTSPYGMVADEGAADPDAAGDVALAVAWSVAPGAGGSISGEALVTVVPLSFWGGFDPASGLVIDEHHPLCGAALAGRVLVMPSGRGSCSASGVLLESICLGTAPAAILTRRPDPILVLGAVLAEELHELTMPVGTLAGEDAAHAALAGRMVTLTAAGVTVRAGAATPVGVGGIASGAVTLPGRADHGPGPPEWR